MSLIPPKFNGGHFFYKETSTLSLWFRLSLSLNWKYFKETKDFLRIFVHWFMSGMWTTKICLAITFYMTKSRSISMCLILACKIWFPYRMTTYWLPYKTVDDYSGTQISFSMVWIHKSSSVTWARLFYFPYVLHLVTISYFIEHRETIAWPK